MAKEMDPWSNVDVKDYDRLIRDFGIQPMNNILKKLPDPLPMMRRGIIFGHRDFGLITDAVSKKKEWVMMTGLMPTGKFHIGHMMVAQQIIYYQSIGAKIFLCVADIEAHNVRGLEFDQLRKTAIDEYLTNFIALGLKPKNLDFYFQSNRDASYYKLAATIGRRTTYNEMKDIYGDISPAKTISSLIQVADILHPQLDAYGGPKPVLVPVGADQDPHVRLTRDLASRMSCFIPPAATFHKLLPGLKGGKMSSSDPSSFIALTDTPQEAKKKIFKYAFSGGANNIDEHRKKGGNTEIDVSYQYLKSLFEPDDTKLAKINQEYESGRMLTGELKTILVEKMQKFLEEHAKKREKAKDVLDKYIN
ncbi:MAG: tryptophan--tRNA ligase [Candidatus Aenigmatarchaeota archaeon]